MQLSIAPKFITQQQALTQPATKAESSAASSEQKSKPSPFYAVAVVVRISILGAILFYALTFGPW
jgi:hypothetical protein